MFESRFTPTEIFFYSNKGLREVVVSLAREVVFGYFRLRFVTEIPQRIPLHESPLPLVEITNLKSPTGGSSQARGAKMTLFRLVAIFFVQLVVFIS